MTAAKAAAAIMAMNNVYYRALHLMHNPEYRTLPARLRMNIIRNPGVEKIDFELWSMAVSAINGVRRLSRRARDRTEEARPAAAAIQASMRIAAVVNAISRVLAGEAASAG